MSNSMYYYTLYNKLCQSRKCNKIKYKKGSGLHKHHIIPKHNGGNDDISNLTYLTIREHIIAHFLLWKIHKLPNDLRAMKMLGYNMTPHQRKIIGKYCYDNHLGWFNPKWDDERKNWTQKGLQSQKDSGSENTFYYWSTKKGQKQRASMGGHASFKSNNNSVFKYWCSPEGIKERASRGGKAHKGKRVMHKPSDKSFIRVPPDQINQKKKEGYIFGSPIKTTSNKKIGPSPNRKKVTDGIQIFNSMKEASEKYNKTPSAITFYCKSINHPDWNYI